MSNTKSFSIKNRRQISKKFVYTNRWSSKQWAKTKELEEGLQKCTLMLIWTGRWNTAKATIKY